jgi:hypothetical protein
MEYAMKQKVGLCIVMIFALLAACSNLDDPSGPVGVGGNAPHYPIPLNQSNPYDSVGMMHNHALAFAFRKAATDPSGDSDLEKFTRAMKSLPDSANLNIPDIDQLVNYYSDMMVNNPNTDWAQYAQDLNDANHFTVKELHYINAFGYALKHVTTEAELEDSILALENRIVNETWGSNEPKALIMISIAKHSFYFWQDALDADGLHKCTIGLIAGILAGDVVGFLVGVVDEYIEDEDWSWVDIGVGAAVGSGTFAILGDIGFGFIGAVAEIGKSIWEWIF